VSRGDPPAALVEADLPAAGFGRLRRR
jgi:hypothetical protein